MKTIKLTQNKVALIDDEDFERVNQFNWHVSKQRGYWRARRNIRFKGKQTTLLMTRYILNVTGPKLDVDHINGKTLDNRRSNLRICTNAQNIQISKKRKNCSSIYKGICWHKPTKKWMARIFINHKSIHLGLYNNEKTAFKIYCKAAMKYYGEFAHF